MSKTNTKLLDVKPPPQEPGIYIMKDKNDQIIYIGKAKSLKRRVYSYFTNISNHNIKTQMLVKKINDIEYIVTDNETEAFILESNLIKKYRPDYNIALKDQQKYTYLKITNEEFPRLLITRRNREGKFQDPKGKVYGPFLKGGSKSLSEGLLRKLFKIRICNRLPNKPCLEYFIKNCDAPCINKNVKNSYMENVSQLQNILEGKTSLNDFIIMLHSEMKMASDLQNYERAIEIRNTLDKIHGLKIKQKMEKGSPRVDEEYIGILDDKIESISHILTFKRINGVISDRKKFHFDIVGDNSFVSFLSQYYSNSRSIPEYIYVNQEIESRNSLEELLRQLSNHRVTIVILTDKYKNKEKLALMNLINHNLEIYLKTKYNPILLELKNSLCLKYVPRIIDCFDISNFGTSIAVGSCTRFTDGIPDKTGYRKFKINTVTGQNDFAMINEIVTRRYTDTNDYPDLIVIDGGKGQLNYAQKALDKLKLKIPCISIAKENEEIFTQVYADSIVLPRRSPALKIIQYIRDEAHRFGLRYNQSLRTF